MTQVLAVDDDAAIRRLLGAVLQRGKFDMVPAANAQEALRCLDKGSIEAVVLDLGLPDRDGLELIAAIRERLMIPIVVLSARSESTEKIAALDLGADDYVTKPFDADELLARLRSALRRAAPAALSEVISFGVVSIDVARHVVKVDGRDVALTPREFDVLTALTRAEGRILTHTALLEEVWGKAHRNDVEYLRVVIRALRLKIEANPSEPQIIRNEPGIGYRVLEHAR